MANKKVTPLNDTAIKTAKPRDKEYTLLESYYHNTPIRDES